MAKTSSRAYVESFTNRYLDELIDRLKLPSDYALAEILDLTPQAIYKMRGGGAMGVKTAWKIAEFLEVDPKVIIARTQAEADGSPFWKDIAKRVAMVLFAAGAASGGFNSNGIASPSSAPSPIGETSANSLAGIHIVRQTRRRKRTAGWSSWWAALASLAVA